MRMTVERVREPMATALMQPPALPADYSKASNPLVRRSVKQRFTSDRFEQNI
jgi:hypothetical protein